MRNYTNSKGFSLIELMVVVSIIGILAAIAVPAYSRYMTKSKVGAMIAQIHHLTLQQEDSISQNQTCIQTGWQSFPPASNAGQSVQQYFMNSNGSWEAAVGGATGGCTAIVQNPANFLGGAQIYLFFTTSAPAYNIDPTQGIVWLCGYQQSTGNLTTDYSVLKSVLDNDFHCRQAF